MPGCTNTSKLSSSATSPFLGRRMLIRCWSWLLVLLVTTTTTTSAAASPPATRSSGTTTSLQQQQQQHRSVQQDDSSSCLWTQLGADIDGERAGDRFGWSMGLSQDGRVLAVGAAFHDGPANLVDSGQVKVHALIDDGDNNNSWKQLGSTVYGVNSTDAFGRLALSGDGLVLAAGSRWHDSNGVADRGHVLTFRFDGSDWVRIGQELQGAGPNDYFGDYLALNYDGSVLSVSAPGFDDGSSKPDSGLVRLYSFRSNNNTWVPMGQDIVGNRNDGLGTASRLSADGQIVAVGASKANGGGGGSDHGTAQVFRYDGAQWIRIGQVIVGEGRTDESGYTVALSASGTILAVSALNNDNDNGVDSGHIRVYSYNEALDRWDQLGQDIDGESPGDNLGWSASLSADGSILAAGALNNDGLSGTDSGSTMVFKYLDSTGSWVQIGQDIDGEYAGDHSGGTVYLSGDGTRLAITSGFNGGGGPKSGQVRVYEIAMQCLTPPPPREVTLTEIVIDLEGADLIRDQEDIRKFENLMEGWFERFFEQEDFLGVVRGFDTDVTVTGQSSIHNQDDQSIVGVRISYSQILSYTYARESFDPKEAALLPFMDNNQNTEFAFQLIDELAPFSLLRVPLLVPGTELDTGASVEMVEESSSPLVVLLGGIAGGVVLFILLGVGFMMWQRKQKRSDSSNDATPLPNTSASAPEMTEERTNPETTIYELEAITDDLPVNAPAGYLPVFKDQARRVPGEPKMLPPVAYATPVDH